jgi:hypothetical protein
MKDLFEEILDHVNGLEIIDTHEHLPAFEELRERDTDILKKYLRHYFNCDLMSAGLPRADFEKAVDTGLPLMERWALVEPYWEHARHTGYGRALDRSVRALYGVDGIRRRTLEELNERFLKSLKPGHFRKVLKDHSRIRVSLLHDIPMENERIVFTSNLECDREFFRNVLPVDNFVYPQTGEDVERVEREYGGSICCFEDWCDACEKALDNALSHGAVALKSGLAYQRSLRYERVSRCDAENDFREILETSHMGNYLPRVFAAGRNLQDYMMHFILRLANRRNLTFQFHTGIQEGNGNLLYHSDPALLSNLFLEYPDVDFDLFHIGYPYQGVVGVLAKNFPNVFIDMCWAHIVSPRASIEALVEWLDAVPVNKISAFGGDYLFVDGVCGHQEMARENVSRALARKVSDGCFDVERAKEIAGMLFFSNPFSIFKLSETMQ